MRPYKYRYRINIETIAGGIASAQKGGKVEGETSVWG